MKHIAASLMTVMARPSCTTVRLFGNKLYFPRGIPEGKWVSKTLLAPAKPLTKKAKPPPKSAAQSIPVESGEHVQGFKVKWSRTKKFYTEPVKE